jgi:hypothetical protein
MVPIESPKTEIPPWDEYDEDHEIDTAEDVPRD